MDKNDKQNKKDIKIITLGDSNVGKSSLIIKYVDDKFSKSYLTSMGFDIKNKNITLKDGTKAKVMIFDTAGQERFKALSESYIKKADGILLVYNISDEQSFQDIEHWMKNVKELIEDKLPIILIGNKIDLYDERKVSIEEGQEKAREYGIPFYETSCKTGNNINKCFNELAELAYEKVVKNLQKKSNQVLTKSSSKSKKKGCC